MCRHHRLSGATGVYCFDRPETHSVDQSGLPSVEYGDWCQPEAEGVHLTLGLAWERLPTPIPAQVLGPRAPSHPPPGGWDLDMKLFRGVLCSCFL